MFKSPALTYFRSKATIIGEFCLTTVFGMRTGVTRILWAPSMFGGRRSCESYEICKSLWIAADATSKREIKPFGLLAQLA